MGDALRARVFFGRKIRLNSSRDCRCGIGFRVFEQYVVSVFRLPENPAGKDPFPAQLFSGRDLRFTVLMLAGK